MSRAALAKRKLVEPTYWTSPDGVRVRPVATYGPAVAELCDQAGFTPDPQQELGLDLTFAIRADGSPASFSGCVICARQNLKSGLFLQCVIGWLFVLDDVPEIAWSAHELRTSLDGQAKLYEILESPVLSRYLKPARPNGISPSLVTAHSQEHIELTTGQKVWFQTRTRDGGRGLGKPKLILDEAFKLKSRTIGALLPILLAQHFPQVLYGSSAPPYDPDAAVLRDLMDRGRHHKSPELWYLEWLAKREACADPDCLHPKDAVKRGIDCALDREHLILQANPTVDRDRKGKALDTGRITIRTVRNLRQDMPPEEYMRECLGWAEGPDDSVGPPAINVRTWIAQPLVDQEAPLPTRAALVIDVAPDRSRSSIGLAGDYGPDASRVLLMTRTKPGFSWVVPQLEQMRDEGKMKILEIGLHPSGQAGVLLAELEAAGFEVTKKDPGEEPGRVRHLTSADTGRGCATLQHAVIEQRIVHVKQDVVTDAIAVARTRYMTGTEAEVWDRRDQAFEISPVVSIATALHRWDLINAAPKPPPPAPRKARPRRRASRGTDIAHVGF